jgi:hypothetical protein
MAQAIDGEILTEWFVAKITEVGAAVDPSPCNGIPHAWTTMEPCANATKFRDDRVDYPTIKGTTTIMPAYAIDGSAAAVDDIVMMRYRARPNGMPVMEFIKGGSGGAPFQIEVVTDVSCVDGVLTVTKETISIPGGAIV